jgi:hypothetical protein
MKYSHKQYKNRFLNEIVESYGNTLLYFIIPILIVHQVRLILIGEQVDQLHSEL